VSRWSVRVVLEGVAATISSFESISLAVACPIVHRQQKDPLDHRLIAQQVQRPAAPCKNDADADDDDEEGHSKTLSISGDIQET
jgi:hypothetical protein